MPQNWFVPLYDLNRPYCRTDVEQGCKETGFIKTGSIENENDIIFEDFIGSTQNPLQFEKTEYLDVSCRNCHKEYVASLIGL